MKILVTTVALFLGLSNSAVACSIFIPGPKEQFQRSDLVVLAYPVSTSFKPKEAASPNRLSGTFRQTILWEVLLSWKGSLKTGDRFTTRRHFSEKDDCTSFIPVRGTQPHLIFSKGVEPYSDFQWYDLKHASEEFKFLSKQPTSKSGT